MEAVIKHGLEVSDGGAKKTTEEINKIRGSLEDARRSHFEHPVVKEVEARHRTGFIKQAKSKVSGLVDQLRVSGTPEGWVSKKGSNLDRLEAKLLSDMRGSDRDLQDSSFYLRDESSDAVFTDRTSIMGNWLSIVESKDIDSRIKEVEVEQSTVGSRSLRYPFDLLTERADQVFRELPAPKVSEAILNRVDDRLSKLLPIRSLVPLSITSVVASDSEDVMKGDTASGYPYFSSGWRPSLGVGNSTSVQMLQQVFDAIMHECSTNSKVLRQSKRVTIASRAIVYFRGHITDQSKDAEKRKSTRLVWAAQKWETILWKTLLTPLMKHISHLSLNGVKHFIGIYSEYETAIEVQKLMAKGGQIISGDLSQFDLTKGQPLSIRIAYIISNCFRHQEIRDQIINLAYSTYYNSGGITATKIYEPGPVTQLSGSGTTLMFNTLTVFYVLLLGDELGAWKLNGSLGLGDDFAGNLIGADRKTVEEVFSLCGFVAKAEDQKISDNSIHFLQRLHLKGMYGGIYPTTRAIAHIMAPETRLNAEGVQRNYLELVRYLALAHNCEFNPLVADLVEFLRSYHKYDLYPDLSVGEVMQGTGTEGVALLSEMYPAHKGKTGSLPLEMWTVEKLRRREEVAVPAEFRHVYGDDASNVSTPASGEFAL